MTFYTNQGKYILYIVEKIHKSFTVSIFVTDSHGVGTFEFIISLNQSLLGSFTPTHARINLKSIRPLGK